MSKNIITFPSDKNACGHYRNMIPMTYLSAKEKWNVTFLYQFVYDLNLIKKTKAIMFQRQCTENQFDCILEYKNCILKIPEVNTKIVYELDDLVHAIEMYNSLAYQFYTPTKKNNVVNIMKMADRVTFSTNYLKNFYQQQFGINHSVVVPNYLPKFLWNPDFTKDKRTHSKKPTIIWAGSASHIGKGGDLEFLFPMIKATLDEFHWKFIGVVPEDLKGKVELVPWSDFMTYAHNMQNIKADIALAPIKDSVFNRGKSDLKYLEYAAMNIPCICSNLKSGPYDGTNCQNLIENCPDSWYNCIKELLDNPNKYQSTLKAQQDYVSKRWLEDNWQIYDRVYSF